MKELIPRYLQISYIDDCIEQTILWMNGQSVHRNDECTTDFSCCHPELQMAPQERQKVGSNKLDELHERREGLFLQAGEVR